MIVDSSCSHGVKGGRDHLQRHGIAAPPMATKQEGERCGRGEFRCASESTEACIKIPLKFFHDRIKNFLTDGDRSRGLPLTL
jgi:hypothetical protein